MSGLADAKTYSRRGKASGRQLEGDTKLIRIIRERGWTARELAKTMGVDEGHLVACIHGKSRLRLSHVSALARILDADQKELVE